MNFQSPLDTGHEIMIKSLTIVTKIRNVSIMKKLVLSLVAVMSMGSVLAAGFGLYEASARGNALGGTLVGSTKDASAVYYNPANMTETTNVSVMVGATMVWLYSDIAVDYKSDRNMNPGIFCIPHFYVTTPVWGDLFFGLGIYCEDGLGTRYGDDWALAGDTTKTTMEQFTLNPNLAYKITDWWSVGAGLKMSYITFYNKGHPHWDKRVGTQGYNLTSELDGDDITMGYNFGTTFELLDSQDLGRLALGVVYRSQLKHNISGDYDINGTIPVSTGRGTISLPYSRTGGDTHSDASARLTLPQSITAGLNWDSPKDVWHVGLATTWTQWSCVDTISFKIPAKKMDSTTGRLVPTSYDLPLNWDDVWRFSLGIEYEATDDLALRLGYVFDMDPSNKDYGTTMLPGGHRNIIGLGFGYNIWDNLRLDIGYNLVIMVASSREITVNGQPHLFKVENAYSHMLGASLSYTF